MKAELQAPPEWVNKQKVQERKQEQEQEQETVITIRVTDTMAALAVVSFWLILLLAVVR